MSILEGISTIFVYLRVKIKEFWFLRLIGLLLVNLLLLGYEDFWRKRARLILKVNEPGGGGIFCDKTN